jgi:hypothetical protein
VSARLHVKAKLTRLLEPHATACVASGAEGVTVTVVTFPGGEKPPHSAAQTFVGICNSFHDHLTTAPGLRGPSCWQQGSDVFYEGTSLVTVRALVRGEVSQSADIDDAHKLAL